MTIDLDAIKARAKAATEGPWEVNLLHNSYARVIVQGTAHKNTVGIAGIGHTEIGAEIGKDASFIACAREDIPALIAEVERLRGLLEDEKAESSRLRARLWRMDNV